MHKDDYFTGQPVFSQLLSFVNRSEINRLAKASNSDKYYKKFKTYDHLVTMLYAIFQRCTSLREVTSGMQASMQKLNHLGMTYCPRRSTLSEANANRTHEVFEKIYMSLYNKYGQGLPDSRSKKSWMDRLYIIDSTTIQLFSEILRNTGVTDMNGRTKGGMKVHTLIKASEDVPCLVKLTQAAQNDVNFIDKLELPKGSIVTFDKGYINYAQYDLWDSQKVYWVTRLKKKGPHEILSDRNITTTDTESGVQSDHNILLGGASRTLKPRTKARLIKFYDQENDKHFNFITNNKQLSAKSIALIYKRRWQIELLFKRIKQNYPLRHFLGDNENAIKIQAWCALIADLILKIVKSKVKRNWSFSGLASMIRIHLMSYIKVMNFLDNPDKFIINTIINAPRPPTLF
jgi:hypothetical protein